MLLVILEDEYTEIRSPSPIRIHPNSRRGVQIHDVECKIANIIYMLDAYRYERHMGRLKGSENDFLEESKVVELSLAPKEEEGVEDYKFHF